MGVLLDNVRQGFNLLFTPVLYYGVVASIALQLTTWEKGDRTQDKYQDQYANKADSFDFIIVGGGTAGSVLANRISASYSVLLLEAGGEPHPLQFVPGMARSMVGHPQTDWLYKTVAQKKSAGFSQYRRSTLASGKGLGGSGSLDFVNYLRGNPEDFNNWARITKDVSWKYEHLLPHFQKAEDLLGNSTDPGAHRHGGELRIQRSDYQPLANEFLAAALEQGYSNVDLNGHFTQGFDYVYSSIKKGERQAPVRAFIDPVRKRKNLVIRKFAEVTKIRFRDDQTAYGVEYERHGEKFTVYAVREIIISAGAIGSPKVLMLSGVGPKAHLEEFGIKNIANLPVGQNLQDHVGTYLGPFLINEPLSFLKERDITAKSYLEYGTQGTGPLTSGGFQAQGLLPSTYAKGRGEENWPDLHLSLFATSVDPTFSTDMAHTHGLQMEVLKKYYQHAQGKHSFHILTSLSRPAGRGEIRLASRKASDPLVINPKYLEDPWSLDIKALVDGVKKALRLVEGSTSFQNIGGHFTAQVLPGCESTKFRSDEYFECYIRHYTVSLYNPVGTCAMGPSDSLYAVVDPKLRVIGTKNLRVIDASVMPSIVVGGTQAATIMIAEKGAQMILNYWSYHNPAPFPEDLKHGPEVNVDHAEDSNSIDTAHSAPVPQTIDPSKAKGLKLPASLPYFLVGTKAPTPTIASTIVTTLAPSTTSTIRPHRLNDLNPFSVSIRTSNPSPIPFRQPLGGHHTSINEIRPLPLAQATRPPTTPIPTTSTVSYNTVPTSITHPIVSHKKPTKPVDTYSYSPLPKLKYFPTGKPQEVKMKRQKETLRPNTPAQPPQYFHQETINTPLNSLFETTTLNSLNLLSPFDMEAFSNLSATTYRPREDQFHDVSVHLMDPSRPEVLIDPAELTKPQQNHAQPLSTDTFGQSMMYLVQKTSTETPPNYLRYEQVYPELPRGQIVPPVTPAPYVQQSEQDYMTQSLPFIQSIQPASRDKEYQFYGLENAPPTPNQNRNRGGSQSVLQKLVRQFTNTLPSYPQKQQGSQGYLREEQEMSQAASERLPESSRGYLQPAINVYHDHGSIGYDTAGGVPPGQTYSDSNPNYNNYNNYNNNNGNNYRRSFYVYPGQGYSLEGY